MRLREAQVRYKKNNGDKIKNRSKKYYSTQKEINPDYSKIRNRIIKIRNQYGKDIKLTEYVDKLLKDGMTKENYQKTWTISFNKSVTLSEAGDFKNIEPVFKRKQCL